MVDFRLAFQNSEAKIPLPHFGDGIILEPTAEDEEETNEGGINFDDTELLRSGWAKFAHSTDFFLVGFMDMCFRYRPYRKGC